LIDLLWNTTDESKKKDDNDILSWNIIGMFTNK